MKNSKYMPVQICIISLAVVIFEVVFQKFGTFPNYSKGSYSNMQTLGIIFPLIALIIPLFIKSYRENLWNKKSIILLVVVLIINTILVLIIHANKEYYWYSWFDEHWTRDNCPSIRWDIWEYIANKEIIF